MIGAMTSGMARAMPAIKICGLTRVQDAAEAYGLGAWALGFVFYARSPRAIEPSAARAILRELPGDALGVGVFVNSSIEDIAAIAAAAGLGGVQLHGDEAPDFARELRGRLPARVQLFKALRPREEGELRRMKDFAFCDGIVLESAAAGDAYGGAGLPGDWRLAAQAARQARVILAGGLNPDNVAAAVGFVEPFAVDVSSGVEESAGIKSVAKIKAFIEGVRYAPR